MTKKTIKQTHPFGSVLQSEKAVKKVSKAVAKTQTKTPRNSGKGVAVEANMAGMSGFGVPGSTNFDGANYSRFRSWLHGLQTKGLGGEVTAWVRTELNRRAKRLFNDSPAIRFLCAFLQRHVVGIGIFPVAMTSDEEWNVEAEALFDNWANNKFYCDARGQKTFWQRQRQCVIDWFRSGESFVKKSFSANGFPQFQSFGANEIGNSGKEKDGERVVDGVILNSLGGVVGFRIPNKDGGFDVYADAMCHVADLERDDGQLRAPTAMYTGLNATQDLMEMGTAEKVRHKMQSMITAVIKRKGDASPVKKSMGSMVSREQAKDSNGEEIQNQVQQLIEKVGGFGALAYLATGEELQFLRVEGNDAFEKLQMVLVYEIAWSLGINPETAFYLSKLGGTANRAGLEDFAAMVMVFQDRLNEQLNTPFWVWRMAVAMQRGEIRRCKDPQWWKVAWQGPPKMSVDLGRLGALLINLRNNAMITPDQYWGSQGLGWREAADQIARGIRIEKLACWKHSDHEPGETPKITVDYHGDFRIVAGRTDAPQNPPEETPPVDEENEDFIPSEADKKTPKKKPADQ